MVTVVLGLPPPPGLLPLGLFPLRLFPARMMPSLCVAGNEDTGKRPFGWEMWRKCECNVVGGWSCHHLQYRSTVNYRLCLAQWHFARSLRALLSIR